MKKTIFYFSAILIILILLPIRVYAQHGIQVEGNEGVLNFPEGIKFRLEVVSDEDIEEIVLIYGTDGRTCQSAAARQPVEFAASTNVSVEWEWEWKRSGFLPPGIKVWWQWEIIDQSGETLVTAQKTITVNDRRHTWKRIRRAGLILQWYEGDEAFGEALTGIASQSLTRLEKEMGVSPEGDITITVYPNSDEVRNAVIGATDWVGGIAFPDCNSVIISVSPGELEWAANVIPHELGHLVVDTKVFNCHGVWLPTWLSEGLAEVVEGSLSPELREYVVLGLEEGKMPALKRLASGFSAYEDEAALAYLQSGSVVDYLIQEHGKEKLGVLLATIQQGKPIDPALEEIYGFDTNGLDEAWRASMGFSQADESKAFDSHEDQDSGKTEAIPASTPIPTLPIMVIDPTATSTATPTKAPTPTSTPTMLPNTPTVTLTTANHTPTQVPSATQDKLPLPATDTEPPLGCTSILVTGSVIGCILLLCFVVVLRVKRR
jgi:hypothetical protein